MITLNKNKIEIVGKFSDNTTLIYSEHEEIWNYMKQNKINPHQTYFDKHKIKGYGYLLNNEGFEVVK
jgi:hypothetical protein